MESLKIRDKKINPTPIEETVATPIPENNVTETIEETPEFRTEEITLPTTQEGRRNKLTIGQKIMESVKNSLKKLNNKKITYYGKYKHTRIFF